MLKNAFVLLGKVILPQAVLAIVLTWSLNGDLVQQRQRIAAATARQKAAAARMKEDRVRQAAIDKDRADLEKQVAESAARERQVRQDLTHTLAAADYVKADLPDGVLATASMTSATQAVRFEQAIKKGDERAVAKLTSEVLTEDAPCVSEEPVDAEDNDGGCDDTEPYDDACTSVPKRRAQSLDWTCQKLVHGSGVPTMAFCTASAQYGGKPGSIENITWNLDALPTTNQLVRTAFVHGGVLHIRDWPSPHLDNYYPTNVDLLLSCRAENERRSCAHDCDVAAGRVDEPCANGGCGMCGDGEEGEDEGEDNDHESAAVREARQRAEAAEAAATEARAEAEYQECLAACEPEDESETDQQEATPDAAETKLRLVDSPAPGLLIVEEDTITKAGDKTTKVETATVLLSNSALLEVMTKGQVATRARWRGSLDALDEVARFRDGRAAKLGKELKARDTGISAALFRGKINGVPVIAGLDDEDMPVAYELVTSKTVPEPNAKDQGELCALASGKASPFGAATHDLTRVCDRIAKSQAELDRLISQVEAITAGPALLAWRKGMGSMDSLLPPHRTKLLSRYQTCRSKIAASETAALTTRVDAIHDRASLQAWQRDHAAVLDLLESKQKTTLGDLLRSKQAGVALVEFDTEKARILAINSPDKVDAYEIATPDFNRRAALERLKRERKHQLTQATASKDGGAR